MPPCKHENYLNHIPEHLYLSQHHSYFKVLYKEKYGRKQILAKNLGLEQLMAKISFIG